VLELDKRIEIRVGSGAYVIARGRRDRHRSASASRDAMETSPLEVLRVRRLVEGEAAALAARHATPSQVARLVAAFNRLAAQMRANRLRPPADREFHLCIARASANMALAQVIERLWREGERPLALRMEALFVSRDRRRDNIGEHKAILDAIRRRDAPAARRAMRLHLANAERQRLVLLRERKPGA
jgi:DNA-binding FadR family transcriptional regulator